MATRLPASQHTREELTALIEGRLSTASAKDELVKLATRLIVEEALEGEAGDGSGDRDAGARALGARHRRCLQGRDWPAVVIEDRGLAAWGAAMGGLPGVHAAGLERVRDHVSVCRWHRRAFAAWRETRAGSGGLGF